MANETRNDFENMTDEDFLKLSEEDYSGNVPEGETSLTSEDEFNESNQTTEEDDEAEDSSDTDTSSDGGEFDESDTDSISNTDEDSETQEGTEKQTDPMAGEGEQSSTEKGEKKETKKQESLSQKETPAKAGYYKLPEGMDTTKMDEAIGFYQQLTAPFKADGKDFTVRSAEDAIRLMQQGVNYSRRMQEIKPMKQLNRMLADQGLNDPNKLNFLIDLSKGDVGAITKLLKTHNIDPMDLDTEKESGYQANNYAGNPQTNAFREALDMTVSTPEGASLITHIHESWDDASKAKLRENPSILGNLNEMKVAGVYDKVVEELNYQRSIGYLQGVPFLQAFDQVGNAMKQAGVFNKPQANPAHGGSMAPLQSAQPQNQPIAQGVRKQDSTKKHLANPHLSSTPPSKQSGNTISKQPDFDKMSDEEFLKMSPPE